MTLSITILTVLLSQPPAVVSIPPAIQVEPITTVSTLSYKAICDKVESGEVVLLAVGVSPPDGFVRPKDEMTYINSGAIKPGLYECFKFNGQACWKTFVPKNMPSAAPFTLAPIYSYPVYAPSYTPSYSLSGST